MRPAALIGNLARDTVDGSGPRPGGAAFYGAHGLRLAGAPARVVTKSEERDRALLLRPLLALGVPVSWRPSSATAAFSLRYDGEQRELALERIGESWTPDEAHGWVARAAAGALWVHLGALARTDFPAETVAALARGRRLSLDAQGLLRVPRQGPVTLDKQFDPVILRHLAVLKLAEEEAEALLDHVDEQALSELGVPEVIVSLGSRGSLLFARGRLERVKTRPIRIADTTGAGDVLAAAYVASRASGQPPAVAARRGTEAVSLFLARRAR